MDKKQLVLLIQIVNIFNIINAARIKEISTEAEYNTDMYSQDLDRNLLHILKAELDNYKKAYSLRDYTDMIEKFHCVRNVSTI